MGGGNGQKAKMAREKNIEKMKGAKGSQLDANKKAMNIQDSPEVIRRGALYVEVQGVHADIYVHNVRGEVQGTCRGQTSKI